MVANLELVVNVIGHLALRVHSLRYLFIANDVMMMSSYLMCIFTEVTI